MEITEFVQAELLCAIPALYALGMMFKKSGYVKDKHIPLLLGAFGIGLCVTYCIGMNGFCAEAFFTGIVQGILVAAASVYSNQIVRQAQKEE